VRGSAANQLDETQKCQGAVAFDAQNLIKIEDLPTIKNHEKSVVRECVKRNGNLSFAVDQRKVGGGYNAWSGAVSRPHPVEGLFNTPWSHEPSRGRVVLSVEVGPECGDLVDETGVFGGVVHRHFRFDPAPYHLASSDALGQQI
jgi:hypothetical protein